ncbi:1-acyl-sn-glycerol-3-phosphate acyltransferase [Candidatus Parcubacteria bacterium]|nr:1-acyl-sn-glycerol-3-phosphate acyltransferase [Candidatus Parcubacteria bacterium]
MNRLVSWFCKIFLKPLVKFLFFKQVKGLENIPKRNFILVSNHQSHLDWFLCGFICVPRRFHFIGQVDMYTGISGISRDILYFLAGVIRLNRKSVESKKEAVNQAIDVLKKGDTLILYPEGTRTRTGEIGKGKKGTAKFLLETGTPILPMAINGTFELMPPGGKLKIRKIVKINIGAPLYFEQELAEAKNLSKDSEQYNQLLIKITNKVMEEIIALKSAI